MYPVQKYTGVEAHHVGVQFAYNSSMCDFSKMITTALSSTKFNQNAALKIIVDDITELSEPFEMPLIPDAKRSDHYCEEKHLSSVCLANVFTDNKEVLISHL